MDWIQVAKLIAPLAPALGGILGGFIPVPGAALAGQALGNVIARSLGVPATPAAVAGAIGTTANDVLIAKLTAAAEEARAQWPAFAQAEAAYFDAQARTAESVNATMRLERFDNRHWFFTAWRASCGWVFAAIALAFGLALMAGAWRALQGDPAPLKILTDAWPIFAAYFVTLAAMVGVNIISRATPADKPKLTLAPDPAAPVAPAAVKPKAVR